MYLAYSLLLTLGLLVLIPHFIYQAIFGKYVDGLSQRLGVAKGITRLLSVIWLHCVSVGETQARPLVKTTRSISSSRVGCIDHYSYRAETRAPGLLGRRRRGVLFSVRLEMDSTTRIERGES